MNWKGALYSNAKAEFSDRESFTDSASLASKNYAFEDLYSLPVALNNPDVHFDSVT